MLKGDYVGVKQYYLSAFQLAEKFDREKYKKETSQNLSEIYKELNQYDSTYHYLLINREISDSLFSKDSDKRIAENGDKISS